MTVYQVDITAEIPYPWSKTYHMEASSESAALSRAMKQYRQDVRNYLGRAKRLDKVRLDVSKRGKLRPAVEEEAAHG